MGRCCPVSTLVGRRVRSPPFSAEPKLKYLIDSFIIVVIDQRALLLLCILKIGDWLLSALQDKTHWCSVCVCVYEHLWCLRKDNTMIVPFRVCVPSIPSMCVPCRRAQLNCTSYVINSNKHAPSGSYIMCLSPCVCVNAVWILLHDFGVCWFFFPHLRVNFIYILLWQQTFSQFKLISFLFFFFCCLIFRYGKFLNDFRETRFFLQQMHSGEKSVLLKELE